MMTNLAGLKAAPQVGVGNERTGAIMTWRSPGACSRARLAPSIRVKKLESKIG